jgi:hypothetical protein
MTPPQEGPIHVFSSHAFRVACTRRRLRRTGDGAAHPALQHGSAESSPGRRQTCAGGCLRKLLRLDYDTQNAEKRALGIVQQSTLIAFDGNKETGRLVGVTDPEQIKTLAKSALH